MRKFITAGMIFLSFLLVWMVSGCQEKPSTLLTEPDGTITRSGGQQEGSEIRKSKEFPDRIITETVQAAEVYRAGNLTIAEGAMVTATGPLTIHCTGKLTLNGRIRSGGDLVLIVPGGLECGPEAMVEPGGNFILVSSPELVPTPEQLEMDIQQIEHYGPGIGVGKSPFGDSRRNPVMSTPIKAHKVFVFPPPVWLPPIKFRKDSSGRSIWVYIWGQLNVGSRARKSTTYDLPHGKRGKDKSKCNAIGGRGGRGGSVVLRATNRIEFYGDVTFNLGSGGPGGNATAVDCCPARARGGKGGKPGLFRVEVDFFGLNQAIVVHDNLRFNLGNGGKGGNAHAEALDGKAGCPGENGCNATAIGGNGGSVNWQVRYWGNIIGLDKITIGVNAVGGQGGNAIAFGGDGGKGKDDNCSSGPCHGGDGGKAIARGGKGGDFVVAVPAPLKRVGNSTGGNGGNATAYGGDGGDGGWCCQPPFQGGDGGKGGDAEAYPGLPGNGDGIGNAGNTDGLSGNGGNGGWGAPPPNGRLGQGGNPGNAVNVQQGQQGLDGQPC